MVLDASVVLATGDPSDENHHDAIRLLERSDPLATLDLAFYEVTNVAVRAWGDSVAARRLCERLDSVADDGGLVRADPDLLVAAAGVAEEHGIPVYDAAYVIASRTASGNLVSCDRRGLVSRGLALLPRDTAAGATS